MSTRPKPNPSRWLAVGCALVFVGAFAGIGTLMWCVSIAQLLKWHDAQSWVQVPALIRSAKLRIEHGIDAPQYFVDAEYEYVFRGRRFVGRRVALQRGGDNVGSFHHDVAEELKKHVRAGKPFRCYVNPECPSEAVLYRSVRAELIHFNTIISLVFGGLGFAMAARLATQATRAIHRARLKRRFPNHPWRWLPCWSTHGIPSFANKMAQISLMATLFVTAATAPSIIAAFVDDRPDADIWHRLWWLYRSLDVCVLVATLVLFGRRAKYGQSRLFLTGDVAVPGGVVSGHIAISRNARSLVRVVEVLSCWKEPELVSSGDETAPPPKLLLWEQSYVCEGAELLDATSQDMIPVRFRLPDSAEETRFTDEGLPVIRWFLEVKGKADGLNYCEKFEVPVFRKGCANTPASVSNGQEVMPREPMPE